MPDIKIKQEVEYKVDIDVYCGTCGKGLCVSSVVRRFYLQQGDTVIVFSQGMYKYTEAIGFECFCMVSTNIPGFVPCAPGLFYGVGYSADGTRYITVKKMWHYRPAVACEWLRLKLPFNAGIYIFGF